MDATTAAGTARLFEDAAVRVWEIALEPGEWTPWHRHEHDYVIVYVTPGDVEVETTDGRVARHRLPDGFVQRTPVPPGGLGPHRLRNAGTAPHRHVVVELLGG